MSELMKNHALNYARRGWYIFPCKAGNKTPLISEWQVKASNDPNQVKAWWTKWPNANIAIHTGKSSLVILDVDPRNGGNESLEKLISINGNEFLSAFKVKSGGGGEHYYYLVDSDIADGLLTTLGEGLDLLHDNKYAIAPPSVHPGGGLYFWLNDPLESEKGLDDEL